MKKPGFFTTATRRTRDAVTDSRFELRRRHATLLHTVCQLLDQDKCDIPHKNDIYRKFSVNFADEYDSYNSSRQYRIY